VIFNPSYGLDQLVDVLEIFVILRYGEKYDKMFYATIHSYITSEKNTRYFVKAVLLAVT